MDSEKSKLFEHPKIHFKVDPNIFMNLCDIYKNHHVETFQDFFIDSDNLCLIKKNKFLFERIYHKPEYRVEWHIETFAKNSSDQYESKRQCGSQLDIASFVLPENEIKSDDRILLHRKFNRQIAGITMRRYKFNENLWVDFCKWNYFGKCHSYVVGTRVGENPSSIMNNPVCIPSKLIAVLSSTIMNNPQFSIFKEFFSNIFSDNTLERPKEITRTQLMDGVSEWKEQFKIKD